METSTLLIICINFLLICTLPFYFFRADGKWNIRWLITALPFTLSPLVTIATYLGKLESIMPISPCLEILAVILSLASISLMFLTIGTHRIPVSLWHQRPEDDEPDHIVTWGAYKLIRHPFYSSFIIAVLGNLLLTANIASAAIFIYVIGILNYTASMEEKRLANETGVIGEKYKDYLARSNRFFPTHL